MLVFDAYIISAEKERDALLLAGTSVLYFFNSFEVVGNAALTSLDSKRGPGLWGSQGVFHTSTKSVLEFLPVLLRRERWQSPQVARLSPADSAEDKKFHR